MDRKEGIPGLLRPGVFIKSGLGDPEVKETEKGSRGSYRNRGGGQGFIWNRVGEPGVSNEQGHGSGVLKEQWSDPGVSKEQRRGASFVKGSRKG